MTHEELLAEIDSLNDSCSVADRLATSLRAVVELHKPSAIPDWVPTEKELMCWCAHLYPCPTIQTIEKELA